MKNRFILGVVLSAAVFRMEASPPEAGYVAHEWGTFTSVQAADGVQMQWNPLTVEELPGFVYSLAWPEGRQAGKQNVFASKAGFLALQRMETPVIYFYADQPRSVDVKVNFPSGTVTEWYPRAASVNSFGEKELGRRLLENGKVEWKSVQILARGEEEQPRKESTGSHYYAARETDANLLRVSGVNGSETEKYLFYRGVAGFQAPLRVTQTGEDGELLELRNTGNAALRNLFVYRISNGQAAWTQVNELGAGESQALRLQFEREAVSRGRFQEQAVPELRKALEKAGLYAKEAEAMVKTWNDSWFTEEGIRVLYILPRDWTDATLPIALSPAPEKIERVMVGRAELITPAMESRLLREIIRYSDNSKEQRALAVENTRKLGLGRFSEAVTRRVLEKMPVTREFSNRAWELLQIANTPEAKRLAQK